MRNFFLLLSFSLLVVSCDAPLFDRHPDASPVTVFEEVHRDFREYYGLFGVKNVDWADAYARHRPRITETTTDAELYAVLVEMFAELDDAHVVLYPATNPELPVASVDLVDGVFIEPPFDEDLVVDSYLAWSRTPHPAMTYGAFDDGIGYLHLNSFDGSVADFEGAMDEALGALAEAPGCIVDIRDNPGGFDPLAQYVAGRFAEARHLYMTVRKRSGPALDAFTDPVDWYVEPTGTSQYVRPIAVLSTYATQSAGETFLLAMKALPHVTHVGETSAGALSDNIMREASNGWAYTISVGDYRDADGLTHESVGIVPDIESLGTYDAIRAGQDLVLEDARAWLLTQTLN